MSKRLSAGVVSMALLTVLPSAVCGFAYAEPNPASHADAMDRGGSYLDLGVDTQALTATTLAALTDVVREKLRAQDIAFTGLRATKDAIRVRIVDVTRMASAVSALNELKTAEPEYGAYSIRIHARPDQTLEVSIDESDVIADGIDREVAVLRRRLEAAGLRDLVVRRHGVDRILIEAPGEGDARRLIQRIGQPGLLTFQMMDDTVSVDDADRGAIPPDDARVQSNDGSSALYYVVKKRAVIRGDMLTHVQQGYDQNGRPDIDFRFGVEGGRRFGEVTAQNIGKRVAIVLDGTVISAPVIEAAIYGGAGEITGAFTVESAKDLALMLNSGALPAPLTIIEARQVAPGG